MFVSDIIHGNEKIVCYDRLERRIYVRTERYMF